MQCYGLQLGGRHSTTELIAAQDFVTLTLGYGLILCYVLNSPMMSGNTAN